MKRGRHSLLHKFLLDVFMTDSARELWNDKRFLSMRIRQQQDYLICLQQRFFLDRDLSFERYQEISCSAETVIAIYVKRLMELA